MKELPDGYTELTLNNVGNAFLDHKPIRGIAYEHNDYVRVLKGPNAGKAGSLVCITALEPEPEFSVELESGFDVKVLQSDIELIAHDR